MNAPERRNPPAGLLLAWYDRCGRDLPWRAKPGSRAEPYAVWLAEIMLQQTAVATVAPYFRAFLARWPGVEHLARADLDEVLHAWQGLGYYARARNMHKCAIELSQRHGGRLPDTEEALRALPGIGPYTAAAIAAIAFDRRAVVVDGNVERVMARVHAVEEPLPAAKGRLRVLAAEATPETRPGDYAQALMDLGATVCTPRKPDCERCPWAGACRARAEGSASELPKRALKPPKPLRRGVAFVARRADGAVLLRRRPERGLLGGMMEVPSTPWREAPWELTEARHSAPVAARWRALDGVVRHTFTHFHLELAVLAGTASNDGDTEAGLWQPIDRLHEVALPTLMKKVVRHALAAAEATSAARSG